MPYQIANKKVRFYINTSALTKEKVETTLSNCNIEQHKFLSNLLEDLSENPQILSFLIDYQIQKNMARPKYTDEDFEKLTGEEAKRILIIKNRTNCIYKERFELKKLGLPTDELDNENDALNAEMSEIKNTAFSREAQEI